MIIDRGIVVDLVTASLAAAAFTALLAGQPAMASRDQPLATAAHPSCIDSVNRVTLGFPYARGTAAHFCVQGANTATPRVTVAIDNGQFMCPDRGCRLDVRVGHAAPLAFIASEPRAGASNILYVRNGAAFLAHTRAAARFSVGARFFQSGRQNMEFDLSGLASR
ncbi:MAG: hypothetical protein KGJ41_00100 [Rhodospirillales bacterium]|nr:hypothetical protein [Rhodospirillales bacterium]MDE2197391.1 hypothetical protein [Rhodospirillales bacterium]MDE2576861.1 hypothetical protein [Rhodospirillales bacterium]